MNTQFFTERIISVDQLRRNFGEIKKELPYVTFIVTDRGKQIGMFSATREMKKEIMKSTAGAFNGTELDNDLLWDDILQKRSRKTSITL
jgi:hypothetical protein